MWRELIGGTRVRLRAVLTLDEGYSCFCRKGSFQFAVIENRQPGTVLKRKQREQSTPVYIFGTT